MSGSTSGQFVEQLVWAAIQAQLQADLAGVMVDQISERDFDEEGQLTLLPPAARVVFLEAEATPIDSYALNYRVKQEFGVICGDRYAGPDPQGQRDASLLLGAQVKLSLVGARLVLGDGHTSDPVVWIGTRPMPAVDIGMAYVIGFQVEGIACFPGAHATPADPEAGENNG